MVFGDFHGSPIEKELPRLEKISDNVVHTASTKDGVDKDFTDFIIFREAAKKIRKYLLFLPECPILILT